MTVHNAFEEVRDGHLTDDPILGRSFPEVASVVHVAVERLYRILRDEFAAFLKASGGLRLQEWRVLTVLFAGGWMAQKDIVVAVLMEQAQVSRALAGMQEAGLVVARRDMTDRRVWCFSLSDEGRRLYERIHPAAISRKTGLDAVLTEAERADFFACLRKTASHALARQRRSVEPLKGMEEQGRQTSRSA